MMYNSLSHSTLELNGQLMKIIIKKRGKFSISSQRMRETQKVQQKLTLFILSIILSSSSSLISLSLSLSLSLTTTIFILILLIPIVRRLRTNEQERHIKGIYKERFNNLFFSLDYFFFASLSSYLPDIFFPLFFSLSMKVLFFLSGFCVSVMKKKIFT